MKDVILLQALAAGARSMGELVRDVSSARPVSVEHDGAYSGGEPVDKTADQACVSVHNCGSIERCRENSNWLGIQACAGCEPGSWRLWRSWWWWWLVGGSGGLVVTKPREHSPQHRVAATL